MPAPAAEIMRLLATFAPGFTAPTFRHALMLMYGTMLASGARTVAAALRALGRQADPQFTTYHRVLNRARWAPLRVSRLLLGLLVTHLLAADAPLQVVIDETLERRRGRQIRWRSWFRDPVRSSRGKPVFSQGVRWLVVALVAPVPWSRRVWALPFLTVPVLAPATSATLHKPHRTTIDRAQLLIRLVRRWQPDRQVMLVGDGGFAAISLGHTCRGLAQTTLITRLRLDAALYDPPAPREPGHRGRPPKKGARQPSLKARLADATTGWEALPVAWYGGTDEVVAVATGTALWHRRGADPLPLRWVLGRDPAGARPPLALASTDLTGTPAAIIAAFIARWSIEVTFAEARAHLGVETQRQWSTAAIGRTTPCLLGLFSLVTLLAQVLHPTDLPVHQTAWYAKEGATFVDALIAVRRHLRATWHYPPVAADADPVVIPRPVWNALSDLLAAAA